MKEKTDDEPNSPAPATVAVASSGEIMTSKNDSTTKRSVVDAGTICPPKKKVKSEKSAIQFFATLVQNSDLSEPVVPVIPTEIAHIAVPPIIGIEESKMEAILPPNNSDPGSIVFYPRHGDVLFGECIIYASICYCSLVNSAFRANRFYRHTIFFSQDEGVGQTIILVMSDYVK